MPKRHKLALDHINVTQETYTTQVTIKQMAIHEGSNVLRKYMKGLH